MTSPEPPGANNVTTLGWTAFWSGMAQEMIYPLLPIFLVVALGSVAGPVVAGLILLAAGRGESGLRLCFALAAIPALGAVRNLFTREARIVRAVDDVSFEIARGELVGYLGPNGAGKSTTIKMLTGILTPTSGEARVAGVVPYQDRERNARNIGAVFGQRTQLWRDLPVRESFSILRDIYEVPRAEHAARLKEFDEILELSTFWDTRVRHLSLGQRVRCDLAAALYVTGERDEARRHLARAAELAQLTGSARQRRRISDLAKRIGQAA